MDNFNANPGGQNAGDANTSSLEFQGEDEKRCGADTEVKEKDQNTNTPSPAPNSKPHETDTEEDTYVYRDFATIPAQSLGGAALHPQSLQAQKLPAKLASILSDQDLAAVITWLPHGRSWRVLNRDLFAEHALPRYFGHKNYASFVRIVNAWGFRRITRGPDRDSYYHELFLRGRPDLNQRMKRLSNCHRKTPVHKEEKSPDFYELAKTSPLPEISLQSGNHPSIGNAQLGGPAGAAAVVHAAGHLPTFSPSFSPHVRGVPGPTVASLGSLGGGQMGNLNEQVLSLLTNDAASRSMNAVGLPGMASSNSHTSLPRLAQLQRNNEDLRRRIMEMESKQQAQQGIHQQRLGNQQMLPDQLTSLSTNIAGVTGAASNAPAPNGGGGNNMLERELERMQREFMMQSNTTMNNSMTNNSLLSSFGGGGVGNAGNVSAAGGGASNAREFSFMTNFPRDEMLLRAMRLENQMGYQPSSQGSSSANVSTLERALQQNNNTVGGPAPSAGAPAAVSVAQTGDDRRKAMMDWMTKQQQQQGSM